MQVFVPYTNTLRTAKCLDYRRLGKQRVECLQILTAIDHLNKGEMRNPETGRLRGWVNHPATIAWRDNTEYLRWYGAQMCLEWRERGYKDTCLERFDAPSTEPAPPRWWGTEAIHLSHQARLVQKDFNHYFVTFVETLPPNFMHLDYVWATP